MPPFYRDLYFILGTYIEGTCMKARTEMVNGKPSSPQESDLNRWGNGNILLSFSFDPRDLAGLK